jgi:hypothetical protein
MPLTRSEIVLYFVMYLYKISLHYRSHHVFCDVHDFTSLTRMFFCFITTIIYLFTMYYCKQDLIV